MDIPLKHSFVTDPNGKTFPMLWPVTQAIFDERIHNFQLRDDDIFIVGYPKSGSIWTKQIVHLLINNGEQGETSLRFSAPMFEHTITGWGGGIELLDGMKGRRAMMTHLPYSLMPDMQNGKGKYIYVIRNPKDVAVSYFHFASMIEDFAYTGSWDLFLRLFQEGQLPYGSWFDHVTTWTDASKHMSNLLILAYEEMRTDLPSMIRRVSQFLGTGESNTLIESVSAQSTFEHMSANPITNIPHVDRRTGKTEGHLRKGSVGDWRTFFNEGQNRVFDRLYADKMSGASIPIDFGMNRSEG